MISRMSFDALWRSLEKSLAQRHEDGSLELLDQSLWSEFYRGDRRYEARIATAPGVSCLLQLDQTAIDAAVEAELIDGRSGEYVGGTWVTVEFCINGPASSPVDQHLLKTVVEEFWPDMKIYHETLAQPPHGQAADGYAAGGAGGRILPEADRWTDLPRPGDEDDEDGEDEIMDALELLGMSMELPGHPEDEAYEAYYEAFIHNHFRFTWLAGSELAGRPMEEFLDAAVETMQRLEAMVPPGTIT